MSRFFAAGSSESESESSEDEQPTIVSKPAPLTARAFMFSDDEEETKRVVRSQKDKRYDDLTSCIKQLKNHKKIKDMAKILTEFENLGKAYSKAKNVVDKEGIPPFFVRCLTELEDFVKENWEDTEGRKKLSKINARALSTLRQKLRKYNRDFEELITKCRENPYHSGASEEESEDDDEDDDDVAHVKPSSTDFLKKKPAPEDRKLDDEESDSDDDWPSSDESSSSGSSSDDDVRPGELTASMFLKKDTSKEKKEKKEKRVKEKKAPKAKSAITEEDENAGWTQVKPTADKVKALFPKDTEITHEVVLKKLHEIVAGRGKKGTDRTDQIQFVKQLREISDGANLGPAMTVKLLFHIISSIFDYNPNIATCMKPDMWRECLKEIDELISILVENPNIVVGENIPDDAENVEKADQVLKVRGCVLTKVERMDDEFTKMLQGCDCHSTEYVERLKDESSVTDLITKLQHYLEKTGSRSEVCRIYLRRIEHIYYKIDPRALRKLKESEETPGDKETNGEVKEGENKEEVSEGKAEENKEEVSEEKKKSDADAGPSDADILDSMCKYIYSKDTSDRIRTRAMLCNIYHHALHNRWFEARNLMLMSHLQETVQHSDIPTQILYNRTMVQLGLCAFRHGMIKDSHNSLHDVQSSGRAKELLAQGLMQQRQHERNPEQEKIEKRRQMPFHMHINLELLECVYLTSAMLLEIPYMAAHEFDYRRRIISKSFHYQLRLSEKQPLVGPPETMREHVVASSKAMMTGDWKACRDYILNVKVWNLFHDGAAVKAMLARKVQEESLRTYLFTYSRIYDSLSLHTLAEMFELPSSVVHSIISKMIINEELQASWDEPTQTVVMHHGAEPTLLQSLALQLAEKVNQLTENNERSYETKHGGFFNYKGQGGGRHRGQRDRDNRGGGDNRGVGDNRGDRDRRGDRDQYRDRDRDNYNYRNRDNYRNQNQKQIVY